MHTREELQERISDGGEMDRSEISEIIERSDLNEGDKERIIAYMRKEEFKGPIPHPQTLQQYEEIQSGLAEKIVGMALKEQDHRHALEDNVVKSEVSLNSGKLEIIRASIKMKSRLQVYGFISTTILLLVGSVCIFLDKNAGSIGTFVLAIASFCWTMFYGKKGSNEETSSGEDFHEERDDDTAKK